VSVECSGLSVNLRRVIRPEVPAIEPLLGGEVEGRVAEEVGVAPPALREERVLARGGLRARGAEPRVDVLRSGFRV